jgi:hypothetical protein
MDAREGVGGSERPVSFSRGEGGTQGDAYAHTTRAWIFRPADFPS